jgi:hypothetical protein
MIAGGLLIVLDFFTTLFSSLNGAKFTRCRIHRTRGPNWKINKVGSGEN